MTHFLGVNYSKNLEGFARNFIEERNGKGCWCDQEGNGNFGIFDPPFCMSTLDNSSSSATDWGFPYWEFDKSTLGWDQVLEKLFDTEYIIVNEQAEEISRGDFEEKYLPRADVKFQIVEISE